MVNYYDLLRIEKTASADEIKEKIRNEIRIQTYMVNSPDLSKKQEAERKMQLLTEAQSILLNESKRAEYDSRLKVAPPEKPRTDERTFTGRENLIEMAGSLLNEGRVADALFAATKATQRFGSNPEAWAILGQAKFRWGEVDNAVYNYKRAISLCPNKADYYFELGTIYDSMEKWGDALDQYQKASQIDPGATIYRAAIGIMLVKNEHYQDGIDILEKCGQEEPDNDSYKWFLAIAYTERAYENWTYVPAGHNVPKGYYATEQRHIDEAISYVNKAESLNCSDHELSERIADARANVESMLNRRFHGSWLTAALAVVVALILFSDKSGAGGGAYFLACGGLYIASCMTPQFILNRRIISGKAGAGSANLLVGSFEEGCIPGVLISIVILVVLPIIIVVNFFKNYAVK